MDITTDVTPPSTYSDSYENTVDFPAGQAVRRFSSGYSLAIAVGRMLPSVLIRTSASRTYHPFGAQ